MREVTDRSPVGSKNYLSTYYDTGSVGIEVPHELFSWEVPRFGSFSGSTLFSVPDDLSSNFLGGFYREVSHDFVIEM